MVNKMQNLQKIILATTNPGKKKEFELALKDFCIKIENITGEFNCPEDGKTFFENALQKAQMAAKITNTVCLADDSGLCVKSLDGKPGLHSARYFGKGEGLEKLLKELKETNTHDERKAFFTCCLVLVSASGEIIWQTEQEWQGSISQEAKGKNGFGFDPIFIPEGSNLSAAELKPEEKEKISHRGKAIQKLKEFLATQLIDN